MSLIFAVLSLNAISQVNWSYTVRPLEGNRAELIFSASIEPTFQLYATEIPSGGPLPTEFSFNTSNAFRTIGKIRETPPAVVKFDQLFDMNVGKFTGSARFVQTIEILSATDFTITGTIDYMVCDNDACFPLDADFRFSVKGVPQTTPIAEQSTTKPQTEEAKDAIPDDAETNANIDAVAEIQEIASTTPKDSSKTSSDSFWWFIILALGAGLAAVLTPCVFPMIPMTVSFFMSGGAKRSEAILKGLIFGFSVAFLYSLLGVIVALTKSADFANVLSTHWISNLIFFALFIAFACSFFGLFEITLPAGLSNKLDAKADKGGLIASFFMAAVLTLVSFSCTGPFVAVLLVEAVTGNSALMPILGMFAFGFALGLPFMVFSMLPTLMKKMPKSGGWLNSVKVVFAFILLAFSMTFLLTINSVYGFNMISREVYIGIWIVIFTLMGLYLLGKIKFSHDSDVQHVGVFRLFLVIVTFSFVVYLIPGLFGAPLKAIASLTPPMSAQQFKLGTSQSFDTSNTHAARKAVRWDDKFSLPHGLQGYFDYEEGLASAKRTGKPIFLDFTGHGCKNCKEMEANVWSDPEVLALLNQYTIIALYTNDRTVLPENEWITSKVDGKVKNTIGRVNQNIQIERFKTNMLPYYVVLDSEGNPLTEKGIGYSSKAEFTEFLKRGLGR